MNQQSDIAASETRIVEMVFPTQTNHYGTLFGGQALALMDKCAFIAASRYARKTMVTASSERIDFQCPVRLGSLVEVVGRVQRSGTTSVSVGVELYEENLLTGERHLCAHGNFVLVAVNEHSKPVPLHEPALPLGVRSSDLSR
ncbi:MAG TPA: acyl-CoA thioesterase [Drouetiella sp.]